MEVWAVIYKPPLFKDDVGFNFIARECDLTLHFYKLYEKSLTFVDIESQARIKRFYHRVDACREHNIMLVGAIDLNRTKRDFARPTAGQSIAQRKGHTLGRDEIYHYT